MKKICPYETFWTNRNLEKFEEMAKDHRSAHEKDSIEQSNLKV